MARQQYQTLDGMRGVAALAVVLFHAHSLMGLQLAPGGYLAVDLFFVLSGFVIAHAYEAKLLGGSLGFWAFLKVRVIRFYPLYLLGLLIGLAKCLAVLVLHVESDMPAGAIWPAFLLEAFFLPAPMSPPDYNLYPLNIPAWSLGLELLVNVAYALAVKRLGNRLLWVVLAVSGAVFAAAVIHLGKADLGSWVSQLPAALARTVFSFTAGVLIYRYRTSLAARQLPAWVLLPMVAAFLIAPVPVQFRAAYDLGFVAVVSPLLVVIGASTQPGDKAAPFFAYLGVISFPIYAIHHPLIWLARGVEGALFKGHGVELAAILIAGLFVGGWVLDRFYDRPARKWLQSLGALRPATV